MLLKVGLKIKKIFSIFTYFLFIFVTIYHCIYLCLSVCLSIHLLVDPSGCLLDVYKSILPFKNQSIHYRSIPVGPLLLPAVQHQLMKGFWTVHGGG